MSRFFKSAAFPILIVVVLAFFAQKLISPGESKPTPSYSQFLGQLERGDVKSADLKTKDNTVTVTLRDDSKYETGFADGATAQLYTSTLAGATVPAAVISMGKNFGSRSAASSTALYPPTVLCEDKASIDCARVMRGIDSIAKPTIPRSDRRSIPSLSVNGSRKEISATPSGIAATSSAVGLRTRTTTSAPE